MIIFGIVEVVLSTFPNLEEITLISVIAALMSFAYSFIGLGLSITKFASHPSVRGSLLGVKIGLDGVSRATKTWHCFQALGNIAFAYSYSLVLVEIQDTLKSQPPENKTMKRASLYGIGVTALFYVSIGLMGYAAFGNAVPGNILTGFDEPFWLVDIANIAVVVHLVGAYQVFAQPTFARHEDWLAKKWPESTFFNEVYAVPLPFSKSFQFTLCKLVHRPVFVVFTTLISMVFPFFNAIVGLLGSIGFWPLTVYYPVTIYMYYPVTIYMAQAKIKRGQPKWMALQGLSMIALLVSLAAAIGSVADITQRLKHAAIFKLNL